jgi:hypothetical protein
MLPSQTENPTPSLGEVWCPTTGCDSHSARQTLSGPTTQCPERHVATFSVNPRDSRASSLIPPVAPFASLTPLLTRPKTRSPHTSCRRPTPEPFPPVTHQGHRFPGSGYLPPMSPFEPRASLARKTQTLQAATDTSALPPQLSFRHAFAERLSSSTRLSHRAGYSPERSNRVPLIDFCNCHDLRAHHRRSRTRSYCGKPPFDR